MFSDLWLPSPQVLQDAFDDGLVLLELDERFVESLLDLQGRVEQRVVAGLHVAQLLLDRVLDGRSARQVAADLSLALASHLVQNALVRVNIRQQGLFAFKS